ncbi:RDD family protein [Fulvivirga sp. M361]|uniref:RDD family protein n=1 Tax=Fulvivirga sp. M361 TaxID=2594266 RepID=UPI00162A0E96|nr:RDD family protein [Fulvivirga sp. M361]
MQSVNIRTTQNVAIDYATAGIGDRIGAFLIDSVITIAYLIAVFWSLARAGIGTEWLFIGAYLPVFFYHLICEVAFNGQSLGKKQMNIKVVRLDGSPATLGGYILRWILRPIDIGLFSGAIAVIIIAVSDKGQRLGDMAAGTTVVRIGGHVNVTSHQLIKNMDNEYQPVFLEAEHLGDEDISIIREALRVNKEQANSRPVIAVTEKVKAHLNVQSDMPPVKFLYTVLKDYNHLTSLS